MGFVRCLARAAMALHLLGGFLSKFLYLAEYATKNQLRSTNFEQRRDCTLGVCTHVVRQLLCARRARALHDQLKVVFRQRW